MKTTTSVKEAKAAVDAGKAVYWEQENYVVSKDSAGQYIVTCTSNSHTVGLYTPDYEGSTFLIGE